MDRRLFLGLMASLVLDPEKLLYVPKKKLISIPRRIVGYERVIIKEEDCSQFHYFKNDRDLGTGSILRLTCQFVPIYG